MHLPVRPELPHRVDRCHEHSAPSVIRRNSTYKSGKVVQTTGATSQSCPKCGTPLPKKTSVFTWAVVGVLAFIVVVAMFPPAKEHEQSEHVQTSDSTRKPAVTVDRSPTMQEGRKAFLEKLIQQELIQKVDTGGGSLPKMWIKPAFYSLDFDTKNKLAEVVYAYYFDGSNTADTVILRDASNGKDIGNYNPYAGGLKLE